MPAHLWSFSDLFSSRTLSTDIMSSWTLSSLTSLQSAAIFFFLVAGLSITSGSRNSRTGHSKKRPPIVHISDEEMFEKPREAYERVLSENGHVVGVWRKGRLEYIVDEEVTHEVLTASQVYSFEAGTATILNLHYFYRFFGNKFFQDLDDLVHKAIIARMPMIVEQEWPVFLKHADALIERTQTAAQRNAGGTRAEDELVDVFDHAQRSLAEAMTIIIFGKQFVNDRNLRVVEHMAMAIAELTGIYQNTSYFARTFPSIWRIITVTKVIFGSIIGGYFRVLGPQIWTELRSRRYKETPKWRGDEDEGTLLNYLTWKYGNRETGEVGIVAFCLVMSLMLSVVFASVHQTASVTVWTIFELSRRPEYLAAIRDELFSNSAVHPTSKRPIISYESLQKAGQLDSFIREVLRTKGDTLSTCRQTTQEAIIAGFSIPKGSLVIPMASLSHFNQKYHGSDAGEFKGDRWVQSGKQASTVSASYFPFGLGRWACPGRVLAISEIKMMIWAFIDRTTPELEGDYRIVDPLNITSVPPEGKIILERYSD